MADAGQSLELFNTAVKLTILKFTNETMLCLPNYLWQPGLKVAEAGKSLVLFNTAVKLTILMFTIETMLCWPNNFCTRFESG